jgi:four helix bundle protein
MRDQRKVKAFALADRLALAVYRETRSMPKEEMFGLTAQLRRGAVSIPSNIAEGCGRHTLSDYLRFLDTAYGATRELHYQLTLAARLGFLPQDARAPSLCEETARVLCSLIRALRPDTTAAAGRTSRAE